MKYLRLFCLALFLFPFGCKASNFDSAVLKVLNHEGFLVHDRSDKGGITNYGISYLYLRDLVNKSPEILSLIDIDGVPGLTVGDLEKMKIEDAIYIYRHYWWDLLGYGNIKNQVLAEKLLDMSINMGSHEAHLILKKSYEEVMKRYYKNFNDLNKLSLLDIHRLLREIRSNQADFYELLVKKHPVYKKFLAGWLKRASE